MTNNFEVLTFCKSRHDSKDTNMLSRIKSSISRAINDQVKLPKIIVLVLDDDLLDFLRYENVTMLGTWIEWLCKIFVEVINDRKRQLPNKAKKSEYPILYWVCPPHHKNFDNNSARSKLLTAMETVFKLYEEI